MNEATAISVESVSKSFDRGLVVALDGLTLSVARGEWVALTGPSGCGKSTLLHLVAALDTPTSGRITVNGRDLAGIRNMDSYRRFEVGLVFQLHNLLPNLTAEENVEVALLGSKLAHRQQQVRAREVLEEVGLGARAHLRPPQLSGGERQRLAIARAVSNRPRILLADEPTGSLDSESAELVLRLFRKIQAADGLTVLFVTHDARVAARGDRIIEMRDGRVAPAANPIAAAVPAS